MTQSSAPLQIPLSQSGPPAAFAAALAAHCAALAAHRTGKAGVPVPAASALLDSLVERVPATGPVATRGPDTFRVRPYTIAVPTLAEQKQTLLDALHAAANATLTAILSPARVQLLNLDATAAMSVAEGARTPAQVACIAAYTAFNTRSAEVQRNVANAAVEIEDLTAASVAAWKVPSL